MKWNAIVVAAIAAFVAAVPMIEKKSLDVRDAQPEEAYKRMAMNPTQWQNADEVNFKRDQEGYKVKREAEPEASEEAYKRMAMNPTQWQNADEVNFKRDQEGYKVKRDAKPEAELEFKEAYKRMAMNPTQWKNADEVNFKRDQEGY
ncbi:hypothetical protein NA57DRAFT_72205 [Rhizodiscina lignyota]|uniref:Uncharacterized protein n=1 Tax=Rhizodiscina lignyota TaxID=1504668 RepID=A0A9P4MA10_9PEZI|nr:hypothetical protein NA57DRAFT_72205 [Rhizodiscina lignyota]